MNYRLEIRPLAALEIIEAYDWYEEKREGLGLEFLADLDLFYSKLLLSPLVFSYYAEPIRQGVLNHFPFLVVYEAIERTILIYSVFMVRRNPDDKRTK